jgi:hypothetical protein
MHSYAALNSPLIYCINKIMLLLQLNTKYFMGQVVSSALATGMAVNGTLRTAF